MAANSSSGSEREPRDHTVMIQAALRQIQELPTAVHGVNTTAAHSRSAARALPFPANPDAIPGYTIEREISRGGQGVVYEAVQQSTGRRVAIKLMLAGPLASPDERARFEREVRVLGRLRHPNIVSIHHSDSLDGGYFYVMDYIAGLPLDAYMRAQPRDVTSTLRLFATICDALNAAHQRGIIHRDLKPGNVRVDTDGVPHVLDFGLSKIADDPDGRSATRTGQFVGSVPWASPEQAAGESDNIDVRTDVYSLGVLLFQMLTDRFPYAVTGRPSAVLETIQKTPPTRPRTLRREISDDVETVVLMCLQKEPARRYQSAGELAADVRRCLAGEPIEARRDSGWYVLRKQLWRHRLSLGVAAAFVALVLASAILAWSLYADANAARARAEEKSGEATARLWDSLLAQARATRSSNRVGRRFEALAVVAQAAGIRPSVELRNEAIAALALSDLRFEGDHPVPERASAAGLRVLDRFAVFGNDGRVQVIRAADGQLLHDFQGPPMPAWLAIFSPDARFLAVKHHEPNSPVVECRVWDTERGTSIDLDPTHKIRSYAFRPDSRGIAMVTSDRMVKVLDLMTGRFVREFPVHGDPYRVSVDPAGERLAVSSLYAPFVEVFELDTGALLHTVDTASPVRAPAWSPNGDRLATPTDSGEIGLWALETAPRAVHTQPTATSPAFSPLSGPETALVGHQGEAVEVYFDPSGRFIGSWSWDNVARFWNPTTGQLLLDPLEGWMISEVADRIAVFRRPQMFSFMRFELPVGLETYSVPSETKARKPTVDLNSCALLAGGRCVVAAGPEGMWYWDRSVRGAAPRPIRKGWTGNVRALDDWRVIAIDGAGVWLWRIEQGTAAERTAAGGALSVSDGELLWPLERLISVTPSSSGRYLAARTHAGLSCFDVDSRRVLRESMQHSGLHGTPSISDDGRWLFGGTWRGGPARVYDAATGEAVCEIEGNQVHGAFAPDGRLVVSRQEEYRVYGAGDWSIERRIPRSPQAAVAGGSAFVRLGDSILAALTRTGYDVVLTDLGTGETLAELPNPSLALFDSICFSADGSVLAISSDRGMQVWDIARLRVELGALGLDWK